MILANTEYAYKKLKGGVKMRKLKKRYETLASTVSAQVTCQCSKATCIGCISGNMTSNLTDTNKNYAIHRNNQSALYN